MKVTKKTISLILIAVMLVSCFVVSGLSASAASGTLAKYYATNPNGQVGVKKTIKIDGDASDWSEDMKIAQGGAWDIANHWNGGHENCVLDTTGLFAAWDDNNLYIGWQMVNTTDTWADREGDGSLSDGGRVLDVPLIVCLSVDSKNPCMTGKTTGGDNIWGQKVGGVSFNGTHVDHMFYMSGKPGLGEPAMFSPADSSGNIDYKNSKSCALFKSLGIEYKMAETNICKEIWGLNGSNKPDDVYDDGADWVDFKTYNKGKRPHKTSYDSFYEMKIPLSAIGISASQLTSKGIGAMVIATRGESGIDCIPFDATAMLDNALKKYSKDSSTSMEKEDADVITVPLARVGKSSGGGSVTPSTEPDPATQPTTATETATTTEPPTETQTQTETVTETEPATKSRFEIGDVDRDGRISIKDATEIQKQLAKLVVFDEEQEYLADYNEDGFVNVKDATAIQRKLANLA